MQEEFIINLWHVQWQWTAFTCGIEMVASKRKQSLTFILILACLEKKIINKSINAMCVEQVVCCRHTICIIRFCSPSGTWFHCYHKRNHTAELCLKTWHWQNLIRGKIQLQWSLICCRWTSKLESFSIRKICQIHRVCTEIMLPSHAIRNLLIPTSEVMRQGNEVVAEKTTTTTNKACRAEILFPSIMFKVWGLPISGIWVLKLFLNFPVVNTFFLGNLYLR